MYGDFYEKTPQIHQNFQKCFNLSIQKLRNNDCYVQISPKPNVDHTLVNLSYKTPKMPIFP